MSRKFNDPIIVVAAVFLGFVALFVGILAAVYARIGLAPLQDLLKALRLK